MGEGVRSDLIRRIDTIDRVADRLSTGDVAAGLEHIRRIAAANGMAPAVDVIHLLDAALARGERGPLVHSWLAVLRDAARLDHSDSRTREVFAAACTVRLSA